MRIQKEGIVGLIVVRHSVEKWLNGEHIGCITLNKHIRSMEELISNCDMHILGEYDVHSVINGKISADGRCKDITFFEAYDMLSEKYDAQEYGYSHVAMYNTTNSELYLCGLEKHEDIFDGKKLVWYYQWFEDESNTNSSFLILSKNEHGEDVLYTISTEDIIYDDTSSSTCKMHHILGDTYMLEYESAVGEHTTMVVFNISKKIHTEYYVDYNEDISFDVDTKEKNVIIHTENEDVVISAEDGTSTKIERKKEDEDDSL